MKAKPIYKIMDGKGRILIPKELRAATDMDYGDIVKIGVNQGTVTVRKVDLIEVGDMSPEAVEAYVHAAIREMPVEKQISIAARLLELVEQRKEQRHE
jgi:bifunctional DNA-binding transcriptional regulator/antitoxin component of YhaV-PrlF toxin-antitoxin module